MNTETKTNIRCIAIDDERPALDVIEKFCQRMGGISLTTFTDSTAGLQAILDERPDIVFLDIEMEGMDGLAIASRIPEGVCFIFTTAYLDYALEGFNLDATDYLHKPFAYSRFETAVAKALRRLEYSRVQRPAASIIVKQEYSNVSIPLSDILYIEAMEGYSKIFRVSDKYVLSRIILKNLGQMLPEGEFLRIHRSYIVPRSKITRFSRQEVKLTDGTTLPIGRNYAAEINELLTRK